MPPEPRTTTLNQSGSVVLDSTGAGRVVLGPDGSRGPATWNVDGVIVQTNRPGSAPIPRVQVYLDQENPGGTQGLTYDGSFSQGSTSLTLSRGSQLIAVWAGGSPGDIASITVTGTKW